ncbi:MAG: thiamine-phosphate kinase [bacterium]|nr:thiamine-phosphate kinase [bacterium]
MTDKPFSEFLFLETIRRSARSYSPNLVAGMGDDCAVIACDGWSDLLVTTDLLIEDVHFDLRWFSLEEVGSKALRVGLSDIAAMGGVPEFAFVSLAVPPSLVGEGVENLYGGIRETADAYGVTIGGGDLSRSSAGIFVDIMLLGKSDKHQAVLRSGAAPGDRIFVSGTLGDGALALKLLQAGEEDPEKARLLPRHVRPEPRLALGRLLATGGQRASAMIDVSDGLSSDLHHICGASGVGARIYEDRLPRSEVYRQVCSRKGEDESALLLHGGEDYELLFTCPPAGGEKILSLPLPCPVTEIGEILAPDEGLSIVWADGNGEILEPRGYNHFRRPEGPKGRGAGQSLP